MDISEERLGDIALLALTGRLTVNDQPGFLKEAVSAALGRGARHVLLDLSGVRYIDSTRLGELIAIHISVSRGGGRLRLIGTPDRIIELLSLAGLSGIFERYATLDEARQSLS